MSWFNFKVLNRKSGVYLLYVDEGLAYIGRSLNLRTRLIAHFNVNDSEFQEWKTNINKIEYYLCESVTDSYIIETYLINTLHPTVNKDKVFLGGVNIKVELPEKQNLLSYEEDLSKELSSFGIKNLLQEYCSLVDNEKDLEVDYLQNRKKILEQAADRYYVSFDIKSIVETLGTKKISSCSYVLTVLNKKMLEMSYETTNIIKDTLIQKLNPETYYIGSDIKKLIQEIYDDLGFKKKSRCTDLKKLLEGTSLTPIFVKKKNIRIVKFK